jgi:GTP-sensing pleiotropic transcriptional regulator CodY
MKLTANISLDELIKSQVAERKGINNNPITNANRKFKSIGRKYFTTHT